MSPRRSPRALVATLAAVMLTACSAAADSGDDTGGTTAGTDGAGTSAVETTGTTSLTVSGVGVLPGPLPTNAVEDIASTTTLAEVEESETIGAQAAGNRVLMLGDSILASTSKRYGNEMCDALVPLGWQVEIDAEVGRPLAFGQQVMAARWDEGWDAGLILLGNNYNGDKDDFFARYTALLDAFEGKPVVVLTVTEFEDQQTQVNEIIEALAAARDNVTLVDWRTISTYEGVRGKDGLHLTDLGRKVLADTVAPIFDVAPAQPGKCLDSKYTDDSEGYPEGATPGVGNGSGSGSGNGSGGTATTKPPTSTTSGGATSTTSGGGQTSTTTGGGTVTTKPSTATTAPQTPTTPASAPATTSPPPATTAAPPPVTSPPSFEAP